MFRAGETPYRGTIESGYISMSRHIAENPNPWGWNPTQYCGLPTQFTYLPVLHYLDAALHHLVPGITMQQAYRLVTSTFACLAPAFVYAMVAIFTRRRLWALAAGICCTFFSPLYGLYRVIDRDKGILLVPWRHQTLVKYGEGPHIVTLAIFPLALAILWWAAKGKGFPKIFAAALLLAAAALTNWLAAFGLAICCVCLISANLGDKEFRLGRVIAAGALAYLLACFWLTPTYVYTTAFNWPSDAFGYQFQTRQYWLLAGLVGGAAAIRLVFTRFPAQRYLSFLALTTFVLGYVVTGFYVWHVDTLPESRRYALEFELALMLLYLEAIRVAFQCKWGAARPCAVGVALALLLWEAPLAVNFVREGWRRWEIVPPENTPEYRAAKWIEAQNPDGRVYASGGLRYRLNAYTDLQQIGGGFETGLRNRVPLHFGYQIRAARGDRPGEMWDETLLQAQALGIEYIVVHGPGTKEYYKDFRGVERFPLMGPTVYRDGPESIYGIGDSAMAHLVLPDEMPPERPLGGAFGHAYYYVQAMTDLSRPRLRLTWRNASTAVVEGNVLPQMLVAVAVNHDPGWSAIQDGKPIAIHENKMGFMSLAAEPANWSRIELRYRGTLEQKIFGLVSALAWVAAACRLVYEWWRRRTAACPG